MLLRSKDVVVSDRCDGASVEVQVCVEEMSESKPTDETSKEPNCCQNQGLRRYFGISLEAT